MIVLGANGCTDVPGAGLGDFDADHLPNST